MIVAPCFGFHGRGISYIMNIIMDTQWQAALAQDIIHAARVYHSDAQALEYLADFAFSLARWLNDTSVVEWDNIHSVCEQRYVSLQSGSETCFDENMLGRCEAYIAKQARRAQRIQQDIVQNDSQYTYQAILARDIISAIIQYQNNIRMLAYLTRFIDSIVSGVRVKPAIDWADVRTICRCRLESLRQQRQPVPIDENALIAYQTALVSLIHKFLPS